MRQSSLMPSRVFRPRVFPARLELDQRELVRRVAIDLVRAHEDERRLGAAAPGRLEQVQRADRVDVEVVERPILGQVVGRLGGAVDDQIRPQVLPTSVDDARTIADVGVMVMEARRARQSAV